MATLDATRGLVGIGLQAAQQMGLHRKSVNKKMSKVELEPWKRVFWALVTSDVYMSAFMGKTRLLNPLE
jgi:hypothetical protein